MRKRVHNRCCRFSAAVLAFSFTFSFAFSAQPFSAAALPLRLPLQAFAASTHNKVSGSTYQLLDGTAITGVIARGLDISHWQGAIDWNTVAKNDISFVMLGTRYKGEVDPRFRENAEGAAKAGIQLGAYIYSYAMNPEEAEAEADFILNLVKDYPISYPIAFDLEDSSQAALTPSELTAIIDAFCTKIENAGYHPILYANDYWLANRLDLSQLKYDVWVARYEVKHAFENPVMWQVTESGSVDGVTGGVDIDFQYKDFSEKIHPNLWRTIGNKTYYYQNHSMQKNTWIHDGTGWFYMNSDGQALTGWLTQGTSIYYLDQSSGRMTQGWLQSDEGWRYFAASGAMQTKWVNDGKAWYYMNDFGVMQTGWITDSMSRYYLNSSGAMVTGWQQIGDSWYYFNGSGAMKTGWVSDGTSWYYMNENGVMQTGWITDHSGRYYLNPANGVMYANTQITVDGVNYQVDGSGNCTEIVPETTADPVITGTDGSSAAGSTDVGNTDAGSVPDGSVPDGSVPDGSVPDNSVPDGSGSTNAGSEANSTDTSSAPDTASGTDPATAAASIQEVGYILPFGS